MKFSFNSKFNSLKDILNFQMSLVDNPPAEKATIRTYYSQRIIW